MLAPTTTLIAILLLGSSLMLLVWSVCRTFPRVVRMSTLSFWCPFRTRQVTAEFQEDAWNGRFLDVQSCDAFTPPTEVGCDKLCLHLRRLPTHAMATAPRARR